MPVSFALATMPHWWPEGYLYVLALPGLGYFRVPARYTLLTSLGLAVLAGEGFDLSLSSQRFRRGLVAAVIFGGCRRRRPLFGPIEQTSIFGTGLSERLTDSHGLVLSGFSR